EDSHLPVFEDRDRAVPLRESLLVRSQDQREVAERRRLRAERSIEKDLLGSVRKMVVSADDMGDPHVNVVADDREVIGGRAVRAEENEVLDLLVLEGRDTVHVVVE